MPILLVGILSCHKEIRYTDEKTMLHERQERENFEEGAANILFTEQIVSKIESGEISERSLGVDSLERLFPYSEKYEERKRREGLHRWYKVRFPLTKSIDCISSIEGVEKIVPVRKARLSSFFDDPMAGKQWHYYNDGKTSSDFSEGADINVETVWQDYTTGNSSVIVAVVDQGVDYNHEDLAANYVGGHNFVTNGMVTPDDHGSHVAGTIAAINNNGIGVSGIAGGNAAEGIAGVGILSCQIFSGGKSTQHSPEAIVWAADNGAVIANNSWGYSFPSSEESKKAKIDDDLKAAIDYFIKYAGCDNDGNQLPDSPMKGGVVIFAAGNDSWDNNPICAYEPVISVGSIGPDYSKAYYSNYGDWVDIAAPGGTAKVSFGQVLSTLCSNEYGEMQGTSMACPHVSGVAALIASYYGGPGFTNDMLKERLLGGARQDVLPMSAKIGPLVDALGSITYGGTIAPDKVTEYDLSAVGNKLTMTLKVTEDKDDVRAYEYIVLLAASSASLENPDIESLPEDVIMKIFRTPKVPVGKEIDLVVKNLEFEKDYHISIAGRDYAGNISEWSEIKQIHTQSNNPPVILPLEQTGNLVLKSYKSITIPFSIYDPEDGEVSVSVSKELTGSSIKKAEGGIWNLTISASNAKAGVYSGEIVATDSENLSATYNITYEVLPNSVPVKTKEIGNLLSFESGKIYEFDLSEYFSDPDEESLTYKLTEGNRMVAKASLKGSLLTIESIGWGYTTIEITASDRRSSVKMSVIVANKKESELIEIYPVPVETFLYVRTGAPEATEITIRTMTGQVVYEVKEEIVSAFEPASIDMSGYAPGRYQISIHTAGEKAERIITKI